MSLLDIARQKWQQIKDEIQANANTTKRVGEAGLSIVDALKEISGGVPFRADYDISQHKEGDTFRVPNQVPNTFAYRLDINGNKIYPDAPIINGTCYASVDDSAVGLLAIDTDPLTQELICRVVEIVLNTQGLNSPVPEIGISQIRQMLPSSVNRVEPFYVGLCSGGGSSGIAAPVIYSWDDYSILFNDTSYVTIGDVTLISASQSDYAENGEGLWGVGTYNGKKCIIHAPYKFYFNTPNITLAWVQYGAYCPELNYTILVAGGAGTILKNTVTGQAISRNYPYPGQYAQPGIFLKYDSSTTTAYWLITVPSPTYESYLISYNFTSEVWNSILISSEVYFNPYIGLDYGQFWYNLGGSFLFYGKDKSVTPYGALGIYQCKYDGTGLTKLITVNNDSSSSFSFTIENNKIYKVEKSTGAGVIYPILSWYNLTGTLLGSQNFGNNNPGNYSNYTYNFSKIDGKLLFKFEDNYQDDSNSYYILDTATDIITAYTYSSSALGISSSELFCQFIPSTLVPEIVIIRSSYGKLYKALKSEIMSGSLTAIQDISSGYYYYNRINPYTFQGFSGEILWSYNQLYFTHTDRNSIYGFRPSTNEWVNLDVKYPNYETLLQYIESRMPRQAVLQPYEVYTYNGSDNTFYLQKATTFVQEVMYSPPQAGGSWSAVKDTDISFSGNAVTVNNMTTASTKVKIFYFAY